GAAGSAPPDRGGVARSAGRLRAGRRRHRAGETVSAVELRALRKRYPPREPGAAPQDLWRGLDLTVEAGEFVAVEGQSGTGKSTLLHILGGLDCAYEGEVEVLGERLRGLSDARLSALRHARIGFIFQSFNLLAELTALENVL